jgi:hypothetical protein
MTAEEIWLIIGSTIGCAVIIHFIAKGLVRDEKK